MLNLIKLDPSRNNNKTEYQCPKCKRYYTNSEAFIFDDTKQIFSCECGFNVEFDQNKGTWTEYAFDAGMAYSCSNCKCVISRFEDVCPECGIQMNKNVIDGGC